jgi:putative ABC transport system substrate-binding protein
MKNKTRFYYILAFLICISGLFSYFQRNKGANALPLVAIANYGPHSSLDEAIKGFKANMKTLGYIEGSSIQYEVVDASFNAALIPQMVSRIKRLSPAAIVAMTTPVAQYVKGTTHDVPVVYSVITDPIEAGLLSKVDEPENNITGSSDRQDLKALLEFAKTLLPQARTVGLLYATAESNDLALLKMMKDAAALTGFEVVSVPVNEAREVPMAIKQLKGKVDFIYVGASGPIQPSLPAIAKESASLGIPVFNVDSASVNDGLVMASFGVSYERVGHNTATLVAQILNGADIRTLKPIYPTTADHYGAIHRGHGERMGITLPEHLENVTLVD